jgi:transmembrane sensor
MPEKRIWELLAKKFNKEITEEEIRELHALLGGLKDPMPSSELLSDLGALRLKEGYEDKARKERSLAAIRQAIRQDLPETPGVTEEAQEEKPARRKWNRTLILAGAVLLLAAGTYYAYRGHHANMDPESFNTIVTKPGSKTLLTLPDGSTVVLNSACRFGYNKGFGVSNRSMVLSGEAYFDIRKNPDMPLSISAGNINIRVLGTSFNVKAYPEDSFVEATLIKGSIQVSLKTDPERAFLLRPHEKIVIGSSNEPQAAAPKTRPADKATEEVITVTKVEPEPGDSMYVETAWLNDKMIFSKEPFPSLAKRMERWFNVKIILEDPSLNNMLFTGSFEQEDLQQALQALHNSARFTYKTAGQTVTVNKE